MKNSLGPSGSAMITTDMAYKFLLTRSTGDSLIESPITQIQIEYRLGYNAASEIVKELENLELLSLPKDSNNTREICLLKATK